MAEYVILVSEISPDDGGGFLAWIPDLPGCMSDGQTREQAEVNAAAAIIEWIEEAVRLGYDITKPRSDLLTQTEQQ